LAAVNFFFLIIIRLINFITNSETCGWDSWNSHWCIKSC